MNTYPYFKQPPRILRTAPFAGSNPPASFRYSAPAVYGDAGLLHTGAGRIGADTPAPRCQRVEIEKVFTVYSALLGPDGRVEGCKVQVRSCVRRIPSVIGLLCPPISS